MKHTQSLPRRETERWKFCAEAWILPDNGASNRCLAKAGLLHERTLKQGARFKGAYHDFDFGIFGRLAEIGQQNCRSSAHHEQSAQLPQCAGAPAKAFRRLRR